MHTGLDSKYNLSHKIHYGRKQQLTRILLFGSPCKQCIDPCGIEQILQHATRHHTDRSLCNKRLEHLAQQNRHLCASLQESPSPSGRYNITKKHHPLGRAGPKGCARFHPPRYRGHRGLPAVGTSTAILLYTCDHRLDRWDLDLVIDGMQLLIGLLDPVSTMRATLRLGDDDVVQIGRASCRERV